MRSRKLCFAALLGVAACHSPSGVTVPPMDFSATMPLDSAVNVVDASEAEDGLVTGDGGIVTGSNTVPIIVDVGPVAKHASYNTPYVTITICAPGSSTNCATIDHVSVDTGSVGLRLIASVVPSAVLSALPAVQTATNQNVAECYTYAEGYNWGSVRSGDLTIGAKTVSSMALHIIGDPALATVPKQCSSAGDPMDTVETFGSNGIIGVGNDPVDCGEECLDATNFGDGYLYYACPTAATCTQTILADAKQVPNPVAQFASDNNGVLLVLPSVAATGGTNVTGTLVFGVDTQTNNALGTAHVIALDDNGEFSTRFNGKTYAQSYLDSGSTDLFFTDSALPQGTGKLEGYFCPTSPTTLDATISDGNGGTVDAPFSVTSATTLFSGSSTAFDDVGSNEGDDVTFDFGFPFFFGRRVFTVIDGAVTAGGTGPFFAY